MALRLGYFGPEGRQQFDRIGSYGPDRFALHDLVTQTCWLLGAAEVSIRMTGLLPAVDILLWYVVPPLNKQTYDWIHREANVYLLCEPLENPERRAGIAPSVFVELGVAPDEECLVLPITPEELALRIVIASARRGKGLAYRFQPAFYAIHQAVLDCATDRQTPADG